MCIYRRSAKEKDKIVGSSAVGEITWIQVKVPARVVRWPILNNIKALMTW